MAQIIDATKLFENKKLTLESIMRRDNPDSQPTEIIKLISNPTELNSQIYNNKSVLEGYNRFIINLAYLGNLLNNLKFWRLRNPSEEDREYNIVKKRTKSGRIYGELKKQIC